MYTCVKLQVAWQGPKWELAVACGSLQGGRADWLIEKCTELGAWSLRPLLTEHSPGIGAALALSSVSFISLALVQIMCIYINIY